MPITDCRFFSGYKPCGRSTLCDVNCAAQDIPQLRLLIIHLGAMGAVVRATSLLAAIKRKYPSSHITWVTSNPMPQLLSGHPSLDRVLDSGSEGQLILRALEFDIAFSLDKSLVAAGLLSLTRADQIFGFQHDPRTGAILPAGPEAQELWELGLDDHRKFFANNKPETQLQAEALGLNYRRDEYSLHLKASELSQARSRNQQWQADPSTPVIGLNTGCGPLMPAKKWTVEFHRQVIQDLLNQGYRNLVLLGGPEDEERNLQIARDRPVVISSQKNGLRDGLVSIQACDLIFTGDSFGMHLAIAMKKFVVAWFGPSCAHEIDLYDRGVRLRAASPCSPCWKRDCSKTQMCYDQVSIDDIRAATAQGFQWWTKFETQQDQPHPS